MKSQDRRVVCELLLPDSQSAAQCSKSNIIHRSGRGSSCVRNSSNGISWRQDSPDCHLQGVLPPSRPFACQKEAPNRHCTPGATTSADIERYSCQQEQPTSDPCVVPSRHMEACSNVLRCSPPELKLELHHRPVRNFQNSTPHARICVLPAVLDSGPSDSCSMR